VSAFDSELPRGFADADFELRELEASAARQAARARKGICSHGWLQGPPGPAHKPTKVWTCNHCGATWKTEAEADSAYLP